MAVMFYTSPAPVFSLSVCKIDTASFKDIHKQSLSIEAMQKRSKGFCKLITLTEKLYKRNDFYL